MTQLKGEEETRRANRIVEILREKKRVVFTILLILMTLFVYTIYTKYKTANPDTPYTIVYAEKRDLVKTITVSGEVVPESEVELGSDASGQVVALYAKIGQSVKAGSIIAKVENSTERAQLTQTLGALQAAQARVESSKVSLAKVENGTREEQLRILESVLQASRDDYESAVQNARNALSNAYAVTNQAVIHGTDALFNNPLKYNPKIDFNVSDSALRDRLSAVRVDIRHVLDRQEDVLVPGLSTKEVQEELGLLLSELQVINNFYGDIFTAIEKTVVSDEVEAKYVAIVTPARNTILGQMSTITTIRNTLSQKQNYIDIAQANLDQAVTGALQEDIDVAKVGVNSAEASALSAGGSYQAAKAALDKTYIQSPQSGVVVDIYKTVGEFVSGSVPIVKISSESKYVSALVSEVDIAKVRTGMEVTIKLDAFANKIFTGTVDFIYPDKQEEFGIVYYELKISFDGDVLRDFTILPGMSLDVVIPYEVKEDVYAIERGIAKKDNGTYFVQVINSKKERPIDDKFLRTFFESGFIGDKYIEVLSGLTSDVEVVKFITE